MSKSYNESSIPVQRGRKLIMKGKRLSSKRARNSEEIDSRTDKIIRKKHELDKDKFSITPWNKTTKPKCTTTTTWS